MTKSCFRQLLISSVSATLCLWLTTLACGVEPVTEDVAFRAKLDDSEQRYVLLYPPGFQEKDPCKVLITLHGHGSDRWQFIQQERGECKGARDAAVKHGWLIVSPDYRAKTSWMGPAAEADLVQIIDELKSRFKVEHVIVSGGSMGGTGALTFTALHPELVSGVVALNPTANLVEYERFAEARVESYGGTREEKPDEYRKRSAEFFPEQFTMPLATTLGGQDTIVPPHSVRRLWKLLPKENQQTLLLDRPERGHDTNYEDTVAAYEFVMQAVASQKKP